MKQVLAATVVTALIALGGSALAHGPNHHGSSAAKPGSSIAPPEQQAWGIAASPDPRARRIDIRMGDDMRFIPNHIDIKLGETVRLVVHNDGKVLHELVLGTRAELDKHAALMLKHPNMAHDDPWMAHVDPGKSGDIYWTFNRAGHFEFACLIPGHFQAGMRGTLRVSATGADAGAAPGATRAVVAIPSRYSLVNISQPGGHSGHSGHAGPGGHGSHAGHGAAAPNTTVQASSSAPAAGEEWVDADIRRVDPAQSRLTLRHGEIKSFDMPPMTMVFHVRDARLLDGLAAGDSVRFRTIQEEGRYIITAIEKR